MSTRSPVVSVLIGVVLAASVLSAPATVFAQAEPCPPGQPPDRPGGTGQPIGRPPQYPPGKCQLRLSRSVVPAGEAVGVAGAGFASSSSVRLGLGAASLGTAAADSDGSFSRDVTVPANTQPGVYEVTATGPGASGGTQVLGASLTVVGAGATTAGGSRGQPTEGALPRTGSSNAAPLVLVGALFLAVGAAAVVTARRRRPTD